MTIYISPVQPVAIHMDEAGQQADKRQQRPRSFVSILGDMAHDAHDKPENSLPAGGNRPPRNLPIDPILQLRASTVYKVDKSDLSVSPSRVYWPLHHVAEDVS